MSDSIDFRHLTPSIHRYTAHVIWNPKTSSCRLPLGRWHAFKKGAGDCVQEINGKPATKESCGKRCRLGRCLDLVRCPGHGGGADEDVGPAHCSRSQRWSAHRQLKENHRCCGPPAQRTDDGESVSLLIFVDARRCAASLGYMCSRTAQPPMDCVERIPSDYWIHRSIDRAANEGQLNTWFQNLPAPTN